MELKIQKTIQSNGNLEPNDVLKIKNALTHTGYYDVPDYGLTPYPDRPMFDAIKNFQNDNNLIVDGIINPNGPTLEQLNQTLSDQINDPGVKSPTIWCPECGGPHGGSKGDLCPWCDGKINS
jgi:Putative peptidoglycan binding domain